MRSKKSVEPAGLLESLQIVPVFLPIMGSLGGLAAVVGLVNGQLGGHGASPPSRISHTFRPTAKSLGPDAAGTKIQDLYLDAIRKAVNGRIDYIVPSVMRVDDAETVTVRIYGASAGAEQEKNFPATGGGSLKVVSSMFAALSEPDNPSTFDIKPAERSNHQGVQLVPADGYAEWDWTVRPVANGGQAKKLHITADMVFDLKLPNGTPAQVEVDSYDAVVQVSVKPRLLALGDWLKENWKDVLKYLVPSGGLTALVIYLLHRRNPGRGSEQTSGEESSEDAGDDEDAD